jgi:hypothetical protein
MKRLNIDTDYVNTGPPSGFYEKRRPLVSVRQEYFVWDETGRSLYLGA